MYSGVFSKIMNTLEYIVTEYNVFYEHFNTQWNTCIPLLHNRSEEAKPTSFEYESNTLRIHLQRKDLFSPGGEEAKPTSLRIQPEYTPNTFAQKDPFTQEA